MPRIPTVNPEKSLSIGNQPNIPMSFGTAPGRAMQKMGSAIKGLGGSLGGDAKANPEQEFQNKLNLLKTENGLRENQGKIESSFNIDKDDPATFRDNQNAAIEKRLQEFRNAWVPSNKKSQYQRDLAIEKMRGNYRVRNQQFATKQRQTKLINKTEGAVSTELNKLNPSDPNFAENFNAVREGVDALINSAPMPDSVKDKLRLSAVQQALKKIQQLPESKQLPFVQRLQESLKSRNSIKPSPHNEQQMKPVGALQAKPGDTVMVDSAGVLMTEKQISSGQNGTLSIYEAPGQFNPIPNKSSGGQGNLVASNGDTLTIKTGDVWANIPVVVDGKRLSKPDAVGLFLQGKIKATGKFATQKEAESAAGASAPKPFAGKILDRAPSSSERKAIFRKGGVVVSLDTNWAKKSSKNPNARTSPMIVIPDDATPAQRMQAEAYVSDLREVYKKHLGIDVKPRVVTRSQNGRGRSATIHTEPFAVTDSKAVEFFSGGKGKALLAQITRDTLGKIPGVHFSIPHMPRNGDNGAHGSGTNEVKFARELVAEMRKPGSAASIIEKSAPNSVSTMLSSVINKAMPALIRRHNVVVQKQLGEDIQSVLKTGRPTADYDPRIAGQALRTPEAVDQFNNRMAFAKEVHAASVGAVSLPSDVIEHRLGVLEQKMLASSKNGTPDKFISKTYENARRSHEKLMKLRNSDPGEAVNSHPEVAGLLAAANDPQTPPDQKAAILNKIVEARLKVQMSARLPLVPITKAESDDLLAPLAYAPQDQKLEVAKQIALKVKQIYGERSKLILEAATKLSSLDNSDDRDNLATGQYYANRPSSRKKDQQQNIEAVEKVTGGGLWESITAPLGEIYDYALGNPVVPLEGAGGKPPVPSEEAAVKGRMLAGRKRQERLPPVVIDGRTKPRNQFDQFD